MIVTTGNDVSGQDIEQYLGVVRGIVVRATGIGRGIVGGLKSLAGGSIGRNLPTFAKKRARKQRTGWLPMLTRSALMPSSE